MYFKTSIILFILVNIASTAYSSEKPSKQNYAPLQVAVDTLFPCNTSSENSPKSSMSDRQATLTQEFPLTANAGHTPRRSFSERTQNSPRLSPNNTLAAVVRVASSSSNSPRSSDSLSEHWHKSSPRSSVIELSDVRPQSPRHSPHGIQAQKHHQRDERTCGDEVCNCMCITAQWSCLASIPVGLVAGSLYLFTDGFRIFT